jgi:hypothetical protein
MKTAQEVENARAIVRNKLLSPGLNTKQMSILCGMLNALVWVCGGEDDSTMLRVLSDEPFAVNIEPWVLQAERDGRYYFKDGSSVRLCRPDPAAAPFWGAWDTTGTPFPDGTGWIKRFSSVKDAGELLAKYKAGPAAP